VKSVLFVVSTLVRSGPTQQLLNLCKYLPEFGWRPRVLTLSPDPGVNLSAAFAQAEVFVETLGLSRLQGFLQAGKRVAEVIRKLHPDIVHTSGIRSDAIGYRVSNRVPHVMTVRNFAWDDYPEKFGRIQGTLMAIQHTRLIRKGRMPVACSHAIARRLSGVRPHIRAIPNGVDLETFSTGTLHEREELRRTLGLDPASSVYLSVGALIPLKQPRFLLEAFMRTSFAKPATLLFLGDGPLRTELEVTARNHGNVRILGSVNNVLDYYKCADFLISASTSEGLPNAVLEAMACGLPVLLSDIEPHLEFQVEQNKAGLTASVSDVDDFAKKLLELSQSDRQMMSKNARNLANQFSARTMAERYARLYSELGG
jgi:glycosyltransferase involved in cell wall biosynthesis